ncbi:ribonuclease H-like domain-containing protein [Tanacetum coccineum]|uniref:Ribonuclease H-like domain-containing protein n=1 Tax=Tanacetum coccineum TaxID=301880 RepID=A0ABQ4YNX0_9ASTR
MYYRLPHPGQGILGPALAIYASQATTLPSAFRTKSSCKTRLGTWIQFTRDNNCTIEFEAFGFSVKDYLTRHILLRCDSSGDLYPVTKPSTSPTYFLSRQVLPRDINASDIRIPNAEPNTPYGPKPQGPTPTDPSPSPQSTLPTSIAHNHTSGLSTLAHQTSQLPPSTFDFPNPQPNTETVHEPPRTHPMITQSQSEIIKPIDRLYLHTSSISPIPKNPSHTLKDPNWRNAMYDEYNALFKMALGYLYQGAHISQQLGVDFDETFSPIVKSATIRMVLSLVVSRQWPIHQLDYKNAFLNGDLSETVYMHRPPGFINNQYPHHGSQVAYLLIYVDEIILTASCPALLQQIIGSLNNEFDMTDLEALNYFLGIYADRTPTCLFLSQNKYALQLLEHAHMICLYMHDPREPHLAALKRILRYVQGTLDLGLHLYASSTTSLGGYTDADWAGCPSTRKSTSGYYVFLGDNLLSWSAKRQHTLSRSSAEAEYRGVANVVAETAWPRNLLRELHSPLSTATLIYYDNVRVLHVPSRFQYADIFTKGLPSALFEEFRSSLSVRPHLALTTGAY